MLGLLALTAIVSSTRQSPVATCDYDRSSMLALDQSKFDQDLSGGWRQLANAGCDVEAANLIRDWRTARQSKASILFWHEGQLRANAGQTSRAISLFKKSRKSKEKDAGFGWNLYVDGTIAFLRGNRGQLRTARTRLAALPRPAGFSFNGPDGKPIAVAWPLNLNVLDGFIACWGQTYKKAYACAKPIFRYTPPAPPIK